MRRRLRRWGTRSRILCICCEGLETRTGWEVWDGYLDCVIILPKSGHIMGPVDSLRSLIQVMSDVAPDMLDMLMFPLPIVSIIVVILLATPTVIVAAASITTVTIPPRVSTAAAVAIARFVPSIIVWAATTISPFLASTFAVIVVFSLSALRPAIAVVVVVPVLVFVLVSSAITVVVIVLFASSVIFAISISP